MQEYVDIINNKEGDTLRAKADRILRHIDKFRHHNNVLGTTFKRVEAIKYFFS